MDKTVAQPVSAEEIPWHPPAFSHREPTRPFTYAEICQVSDVEEALRTLEADEIACWILDLIHDRESLRVALCAVMDALHHLLRLRRA